MNQNLFSFIEYVSLLLNNEIVYFYDLSDKLIIALEHNNHKSDIKRLKDAFYKTFIRYNDKLKTEFSLEVEEVIITSDGFQDHPLKKEIDTFKQSIRNKEKGLRIGYKIKPQQHYFSTVQELFNLKAIISQTKEQSRLTQDPELYLENIDFEKSNQRINQNNWLEWFDDIMISIGKFEFIEIEYNNFGREDRIKVLPMKVRENLYGQLYLMAIRIQDTIPSSISYKDISIVRIEDIIAITKRKETYKLDSKKKQKKIEKIQDEFESAIQSFIGVIVPDYNYRYTPDSSYSKDNIPSIKLKVSTFQLPFVQNIKSKVNIIEAEEEGYHIVEFKTVPTFEFIRYVIILSDVWNYDISWNNKSLNKETAIEVIDDGSSTSEWIRDYIKQTYRRALYKYEDNPEIKSALEHEINNWKSRTYPFIYSHKY